MSLGGFTLADRLGARAVPCRVPGCTRTWLQLGGKSLALVSRGSVTGQPAAEDAGAGMCEPCKKKLATLHDKQRRCDVPGCQHTWTWTVAEQLEAFATHKPPPKRICADCEGKLAALEDKEVACSVPGCTRTAKVSKRSQLIAQAAAEQAAAEPVPPEPAVEQPPAPAEAAPAA